MILDCSSRRGFTSPRDPLNLLYDVVKKTLSSNTSPVLKKKNFLIFIHLGVPGLSCGMWDLIPRPGMETKPPALEAQS